MTKQPSPKADQLRAMREDRATKRFDRKEFETILRSKPKPKKKPKKPLRA